VNLLQKSILILIAFSIFIFLLFVTYLTDSLSVIEKPFYDVKKKWTYQLIKKDNNFEVSKTNNTWSISINYVNIIDNILYKYWNIKTNYNWNNIEINIEPWIYLFQLKEINTKYTIKWKWFSIKPKWPWNFIINSISSRKIIIFSINSLIDLNLKNVKTNENISTLALYPHMYLIFNPIKNIFVKNSDLLRISQVFNLWYFNEKIISSPSFLKLILLKKDKWTNFINDSFLFLNNEIIKRNAYIEKYKKYKFWTLPWEKFIEIYNNFFINPYKKNLYYKNIIIRKTNDLLNSNESETVKIYKINENLKKLKKINIKSYEEVKKIILFQYSNVILTNQKNIIKVNFTNLVDKINNISPNLSLNSLIYLEKIFSNYNSITFYKDINIFINKYFSNLQINIKWSLNDIKNIDYLLYFLQNIINNTSAEKIKNISNIINTFTKYTTIANSFYWYSDDKIKKWWLYTNIDILNKFKNIIQVYYFKNRNQNGLLIINEKANIKKDDILKLENNVHKIFTFFKNNSFILNKTDSNRDKLLLEKFYPNLESQYNEYFSALKDYEQYLSIYDKSINNILNTKTINEINNNSKVNLSIEKAKNYLKIFNWLSFNNTEIKIMDYVYCNNPTKINEKKYVKNPYCYKINNLKVNNNSISFLLYPFLSNKIDYIYSYDQPKVWSYKLDEIKSEMDKKLKANKKNKELYTFSNFLINTFWEKVINNQYNSNIITNKWTLKQDDSFIRIFKRDKLLWELWDFNWLNWVIDIKYNDLNINKIWNKYDIYINSSKFNINLDKNTDYEWLFSSKYNFSEKHSFINPKIKLLNTKTKNDLLMGNYIYINWEFHINQIKNILISVLTNFKIINYINNILYNKFYNYNIKINYDIKNNIITFSTIYKSKKIEILYKNLKIINIKENWNSIINSPINYEWLDTILNKITN